MIHQWRDISYNNVVLNYFVILPLFTVKIINLRERKHAVFIKHIKVFKYRKPTFGVGLA